MRTIKEVTEFGLDMIRGLPQAYYCSQNQIEHQCIVKPGLAELYELVSDNVIETNGITIFNPEDLYLYDGPKWSKREWTPPPLKDMFSKYLKFEKPTVVINNKCAAEWDIRAIKEVVSKYNLNTEDEQIINLPNTNQASVNHYSLPVLEKIIQKLSPKYQILYISPIIDNETYFVDKQATIPFDDFSFLEQNYPDVFTIKTFLNETDLTSSFNIAQFMMEATSDKHLTTIGGNAKISSYFGGDVLVYISEIWKKGHPKGRREIWKSGSWLKHLSNANIVSLDSYDNILNYIEDNWL